ncbi:radical SAM protein [Oceanicola sp. S124]|uniref:radical SAM protein n=1 Tax=Oceanicola sp. S124 TaxID=1042378 RepID=UPI00025593E5|nr:radical SAM protein [Oceanicola sp. S124]
MNFFRRRPPLRTKAHVVEGKIIPLDGIDVLVADHCNIACRQCNHASPVLRKRNAEVEETVRAVAVLAEVMRPRHVKFMGGEPLLNPKLAEIIEGVRGTGIADRYVLVTNGMLLGRMDERIWGLIDELEISQYPGANLTDDFLAGIRARCEAHGVTYTRNAFPEFRRTFSSRRIQDPALVERVFSACKIANVWGCHAVHRGRLFRCPQSARFPELVGMEGEEGVALTPRDSLRDDILAMINGDTPLDACQSCVGTCGKKFAHDMVPRREWMEDLAIAPEDCIDYELLEQSEQLVRRLDDCKTPDHRIDRSAFKRALDKIGYVPRRMRKATYHRAP